MKAPSYGSVEAFPVTDLYHYYDSIGAKFVRQVGSHQQWALPSGVTLPAPDNDQVTARMMRMVAHKLGMSYPELRAAVGHPIVKSGRVSKGQTKTQTRAPQVTKGDALRACDELADAVTALRRDVAQGIRDSEFYRASLSTANKGLKALGVIA